MAHLHHCLGHTLAAGRILACVCMKGGLNSGALQRAASGASAGTINVHNCLQTYTTCDQQPVCDNMWLPVVRLLQIIMQTSEDGFAVCPDQS